MINDKDIFNPHQRWKVLSCFAPGRLEPYHRHPIWGPTVKGVQLPERFIRNGSKGRVLTVFNIWVPFVIVKFEDGCFWSWKVASISATGHRIQPSDGGCNLWFDIPIIAAPYFIVCQVALNRIQNLISESAGTNR